MDVDAIKKQYKADENSVDQLNCGQPKTGKDLAMKT